MQRNRNLGIAGAPRRAFQNEDRRPHNREAFLAHLESVSHHGRDDCLHRRGLGWRAGNHADAIPENRYFVGDLRDLLGLMADVKNTDAR